MIHARNDLCDLCNAPKAEHFLSIPTGLEDIPTLAIRLCPACRHLLIINSETILPLFDIVVRALGLLRKHYQSNPLPSYYVSQATDEEATSTAGPGM